MQVVLLPPLEDDQGSTADSNSSSSVLPTRIRQNFEQLKKSQPEQAKSKDSSLTEHSKERQTLALETAIAIQQGVSHLQNGIAELEALLREEEEDDGRVVHPPASSSSVLIEADEEEPSTTS